MKITCLGTGCPEPNPNRASSGYLVEIGDDTILLDCGGGVFDRLVQSGRLPSDITHLFFTHLHTDHMMDYARLVHAAWDEGGAPLKVFGPAPIASITEKLFGRDGVFATDLIARTENKGSQEVWVERGGSLPRPWPNPTVTEIEPGFTTEINTWKFSTCHAPHAQPELTCMAFKIECGGKIFVYSGDSAICDDVEALAQDADLLIHWCYRLSGDDVHPFIRKMSPDPKEIGAMAKRANVRRLLITHLRVQMDTEAAHKRIEEDLRENFGDNGGIAEDLMTIQL